MIVGTDEKLEIGRVYIVDEYCVQAGDTLFPQKQREGGQPVLVIRESSLEEWSKDMLVPPRKRYRYYYEVSTD